jgi:hypothetical protein
MTASARARVARMPHFHQQLHASGIEAIRQQGYDYAVRSGWPLHLRPRQVQTLNLLAAAGLPLTAVEMSEVLQVGWRGVYSRLSSLIAEGLVSRLDAATGARSPMLGHPSGGRYTLSPLALSILRERAKCKSNDETPR